MLDVGSLSGADSCRSNEFVKASKLAPFRHDQIAVLINRSAVRRVADAFFPLIGRQSKIGSLFLIGIVAELGGDPPLLIQNGYPALQLGKDGVIAADMHGCGHPEVLLNHLHEIPLKIPILDAIVIAIANQQQRLALPHIERNSVTGVEFSLFGTGPTKSLHELAVFIELEHIVRAVPVSDEDRTIWRDSDSARLKAVGVFINARLFGILDGPFPLAIELQLHDLMILGSRGINVFDAALLAEFQAMNPGRADGAQELALRGENYEPALGICADVNISGFVNDSATVAGTELLAAGFFLEKIGRDGKLQLIS